MSDISGFLPGAIGGSGFGSAPVNNNYFQPQYLGTNTAQPNTAIQTGATSLPPVTSSSSQPSQPSSAPQPGQNGYVAPKSTAPQPGQNGYVNPNTIPGTQEYQDQINQQINDTYNAVNGYLDQASNTVNQQYPLTKQNIQGEYDTDTGQLNTENAANQQGFNTQQSQADYQNQNALASARNMYNEVRQGYQQRFGGSTSAADAANQIASLGQQQQEGQLNQAYQQATTGINNNRVNTTNQYQQSLNALSQQRNTALNQAQTDFNNQLLSISQSRAQNAQAKGQSSLAALQTLQQQTFAINQQATQFTQALQLQQTQSDLQLRNYEALAGGGQTGAANSLAQFQMMSGSQPTTNSQAGGVSAPQQQNLTGAIFQNGHYYDPLTGQMIR